MDETKALAAYVVGGDWNDIPDDVRLEARRALVNYVGCAIGGSVHPSLDIALRALGPYSGPPTATILGRVERLDPLHVSLMNGLSSHVYDYDDTTPKNYIHPSSPVASALFAYASAHPVSGPDFVNAFVLGFEVEERVGDAVYPAHYDAGWHITGTAGVMGAAAAIGKLLGLSEPEMVWAIGLGATQAAGLREMFGSMGKALHPGRSAQNGYAAALLAQAGFTAGPHSIEGPRGFAAVLSSRADLSKVTRDLGTHYSLRDNAYKPFPCGIVIHPTLDGAISVRAAHDIGAEDIVAVRLRVAPLVLDLCNQQAITTGLQGKFSVYHGAAIGLVRGKGGVREFTDEAVNDPAVKRVRELTTATGDPSVTEDQAGVEVDLADGRTVSHFVEQSLGNVHRPLTDEQLNDKFRDQGVLALPADQVDQVIERCWEIDSSADVGDVVRAAVPAGQPVS